MEYIKLDKNSSTEITLQKRLGIFELIDISDIKDNFDTEDLLTYTLKRVDKGEVFKTEQDALKFIVDKLEPGFSGEFMILPVYNVCGISSKPTK